MKSVVYLGGKQAGCVGLLTVLSLGLKINGIVSYDVLVSKLASELGYDIYTTIKHPRIGELLSSSDLLLSVHCREIVPLKLLELPSLGCLNAHPCLFMYKGADPVQNLFKDGGNVASVGVHRMIEEVDEGEVLAEEYVDVSGKKSVEEIYNMLYPYYSLALISAIRKVINE